MSQGREGLNSGEKKEEEEVSLSVFFFFFGPETSNGAPLDPKSSPFKTKRPNLFTEKKNGKNSKKGPFVLLASSSLGRTTIFTLTPPPPRPPLGPRYIFDRVRCSLCDNRRRPMVDPAPHPRNRPDQLPRPNRADNEWPAVHRDKIGASGIFPEKSRPQTHFSCRNERPFLALAIGSPDSPAADKL